MTATKTRILRLHVDHLRRPLRATAAGVSLVTVLTAVTACGGAAHTSATAIPAAAPAAATASTTTDPTSAASTPGDASVTDDTAAAPASLPPDPTAPDTITPVLRPGRGVKRTGGKAGGTGTVVQLGKSVTYADGLVLTVALVGHDVTTGVGPGEVSGVPVTRLRVTVVNGSTAALRLEGVVVTATYGTPARLARRFMAETDHDLAGTVAVNGQASADYTYAVPTTGRKKVAIVVDLDGSHELATFRGNA